MAKKTKGLSFDEKKSVLSKAMQREGLFYNLKELEVLGKKNGVIPQAVKEVVDCLIAERVIIQEKIGSLNIFWSFAISESKVLESQIATKSTRLQEVKTEISRLDEIIQSKSSLKVISHLDLATARKSVSELEQKVAEVSSHLNVLLKSDPSTIIKLKKAIFTSTESANIWTDNIFILRQHLTRTSGACEEDINKEFAIPCDFDLLG